MGGDSLTEQLSFIPEDDYEVKGDSKVCIKCNRDLPLSFYSKNSGRPYLRSECKQCNYSLQKIRDRLRKNQSYPDEDYKCPICLRGASEVKGQGNQINSAWALDHCHENDTFRGWLCHNCNRSLGGFYDDKEFLQRAIDYLEQSE